MSTHKNSIQINENIGNAFSKLKNIWDNASVLVALK